MFRNRVVGLAFQGLAWADNIGYGIPLPVIRHFLEDVEDGRYDGYPELGVAHLDARNQALRDDLGLPGGETGAVLYYIDPFGSARHALKEGDVLLAIDGFDIANDGTISLENETVIFSELLERKQFGESVTFRVWRDGAEVEVPVALTNPPDPFVFRNLYDERPRYLVRAGLVFSPLTREYLKTLSRSFSGPAENLLLYYSRYAKLDGLHEGHDEFVLLIRRLPHPVNTYADAFENGIVVEANGTPVRRLEDLERALMDTEREFHVLRFAGMDAALVLDAGEARLADAPIRERYGVPSPFYFGDQP
jgi:hypothetical protein